MAIYKEIVTKAVLGKGKKYFSNAYTIDTEIEPTTVLGCWVINHQFKGNKVGDKIVVDGSYDVNIWYSYDNDSRTSVISKKIDYSESVLIRLKEGEVASDNDIIVRALKQPNCLKASIKDDGSLEVQIEKELGIEVVGDVKVKIAVDEDEEPWQELKDEEFTEQVAEEINQKVNPKFL